MAIVPLKEETLRDINSQIDYLFDSLKKRFLGPQSVIGKRLIVTYDRDISLPGMYEAGSKEESSVPDIKKLNQLIKTAENYIDSQKELTKARVTNAVQAFVSNSLLAKKKPNVKTVLGGELYKIYGEVANKVKTILESEVQKAKNVSILDGIIRISAASGIADPVVFFSGPLDKDTCDECIRLHWMPDEITPKLWYLSEIKHGYAKVGDDVPSISEQHPMGRGTLTTLMPGWGFKMGSVAYIGPDYNAIEEQRKSE